VQTWESANNGPGKPCIVKLPGEEIFEIGRYGGNTQYRVSSNGRTEWSALTALGEGGTKDEYCAACLRRDGRGIAVLHSDEPTSNEANGARLRYRHFTLEGEPS
jgi:hypothetical protein